MSNILYHQLIFLKKYIFKLSKEQTCIFWTVWCYDAIQCSTCNYISEHTYCRQEALCDGWDWVLPGSELHVVQAFSTCSSLFMLVPRTDVVNMTQSFQDMSKCFCFWRKISRWTEGWMEMETKAYMATWHVLSIMPKIHFSFIWMQKIYVKGRICKLPGYVRNLSQTF